METASMLSSAAAQERITDFIVTNFLFGDASRKPAIGESLIDAGIVDSTGILELIEFLESEFGIEVAESETVPQNLDSVTALSRFVASKLAKQ